MIPNSQSRALRCFCFYRSVFVKLFLNILIRTPFSVLSSPGFWGGAGLSGNHVHTGWSWPHPWVPAVPRRGGGARGGGGRRRQREGIRQRQCCGKHPRVGHLRRLDQTGRQRGRTGGSFFSRGEVSPVLSFITDLNESQSLNVHVSV